MSMLAKRLQGVIIESDPDDADNLIVPLPQDLVDKMGWDEVTVLDYEIKDGEILIKEIK